MVGVGTNALELVASSKGLVVDGLEGKPVVLGRGSTNDVSVVEDGAWLKFELSNAGVVATVGSVDEGKVATVGVISVVATGTDSVSDGPSSVDEVSGVGVTAVGESLTKGGIGRIVLGAAVSGAGDSGTLVASGGDVNPVVGGGLSEVVGSEGMKEVALGTKLSPLLKGRVEPVSSTKAAVLAMPAATTVAAATLSQRDGVANWIAPSIAADAFTEEASTISMSMQVV